MLSLAGKSAAKFRSRLALRAGARDRESRALDGGGHLRPAADELVVPLATPDFETADHENHGLAFEFHRLGRVVLRRSQPADFGAVEDLVGQRGARPREIGLGEDRLGVVRRAKIIGAHIVPNFEFHAPKRRRDAADARDCNAPARCRGACI